MKEAIRRERPGFVLFLGDGERDLPALRQAFPDLPLQAVRGNCDAFSELPQELVLTLEGVRFFLTHGHRYGVKTDRRLESLKAAARKNKAQAVLFGHTHEAFTEWDGGLLIFNPGTAGGFRPTGGVLEIREGRITARLIDL